MLKVQANQREHLRESHRKLKNQCQKRKVGKQVVIKLRLKLNQKRNQPDQVKEPKSDIFSDLTLIFFHMLRK